MSEYEKLLKYRPPNVEKKLAGTKILLLNSQPIFQAILDLPIIVMACNIRIRHTIPGILRASRELESIVAFELAKSEGDIDGGYTGQTPEIFVQTILEYVEGMNYSLPFIIHGDHIKVKDTSEEEIESAKKLIQAEIEAGYSSFAIDASYNEIPDNIRITTELAKPIIELGIGLEAEVGEIKALKEGGELTTVEEALEYIKGLNGNGVKPVLLATNNGSKHGNYAPGEEVHIDLERTRKIFKAVRPFGTAIAQHGITGTPLHLIGQFADYGIRKGNVGTQWQNIAHQGLPEDLFARMKKWAEENQKDIKFATRVFKKEIDSIPEENKKKIEEMAYQEAKSLLKAFRSEGSAKKLLELLD